MPPSSLSITSRARRLAPITESPPESPSAPTRSQGSPLRLSFLSLHKTLHRRPRTASSSSLDSAVDTSASSTHPRARTASASTIFVAPDACDGPEEAHAVTAEAEAPAPRNSGTFGRVDPDQTPEGVDDRPYSDQQTPTRETSDSVPASSPAVESTADLLAAVADASPRRSGTFGRTDCEPSSTMSVTSTVVMSPTSSVLSSPVDANVILPSAAPEDHGGGGRATTGIERHLSPDDLVVPSPAVPTAASASTASLFFTPAGSSISLPFTDAATGEAEDGGACEGTIRAQTAVAEVGAIHRLSTGQQTSSSHGDETLKTGSLGDRGISSSPEQGPPSAAQGPPDAANWSMGDGSAPTDLSARPRLVASHAAILALAQALAEEASVLERTTSRLARIRRSLDVEIEGLFGLAPLVSDDLSERDRVKHAQHSRHSVDPAATLQHQRAVHLSPSLLDSLRSSASELVEKISSSSASKKVDRRPAEVHAQSEAMQRREDTDAFSPAARTSSWLGRSAHATTLPSPASLPIKPAGPPFGSATLSKTSWREHRKSWVKRIFS